MVVSETLVVRYSEVGILKSECPCCQQRAALGIRFKETNWAFVI